ncbi:acid-sensing ion channel 4-A-like [Haliotis rufescens]|uniref:acid-sensing ion channel 4-A-like n=1 Tax=Haliotis rufescens TaxID=6454 RepID=UPI00201F29A8|nr:acid-sensing ion channel 4-A-like [Haliotis rufescens]
MTARVVSSDEKKLAWTSENEHENIGSLWADFAQSTAFHGVNKLQSSRHSSLRCIWWTFAVLLMSAYMSYNITQELMNYYRYPVITNTKVEVRQELPFPAITFCNLSPYNLTAAKETDPYLEKYFNGVSLLGEFYGAINWSDPGYGSTFSKRQSLDWWKKIFMKPGEILNLCVMKSAWCVSAIKPVVTKMGHCATFNWNASDVTKVRVTGLDNNLIIFANIHHDKYVLGSQLAAGLRVILHDPRIHPDVATSSFLAAPGTSTYAAVKRSTFKYLPTPYKAFDNTTCVDTLSPTFNNTLEYHDMYTYETCLQECFTRITFNKCGCVKPSDDGTFGRICSIFEDYSCYAPTYGSISQDPDVHTECGCRIPCTFDTYETKVSSSKYPSNVSIKYIIDLGFAGNEAVVRDNYLEIRIYYENLMLQVTEQIPQYTTETIIGNLGGQMGICLGASILTLTELGEFLLLLCLFIFKRIQGGGELKRIKPNKN